MKFGRKHAHMCLKRFALAFLSAWTSDQSSLLSCSDQIQGILYPDGEGGHLFLFHIYMFLFPC